MFYLAQYIPNILTHNHYKHWLFYILFPPHSIWNLVYVLYLQLISIYISLIHVLNNLMMTVTTILDSTILDTFIDDMHSTYDDIV